MGQGNEKQSKFMHVDKSFKIVFQSGSATELDQSSFQFIIDIARPSCTFMTALQKTKNDLSGTHFSHMIGENLNYEHELSEVILRHIDVMVTDHFGAGRGTTMKMMNG